MSSVTRVQRGKSRSFSTTAISIVLGLFAVLFLVRFGQELLLEHDLMEKASVQRRANAALRDNNTRMKARLEYYQSAKYIEQRAREDLNLRRSDEEVLVPVSVDAPNAGDEIKAAKPEQEAAGPSKQPDNWQKWFSLFEPPAGTTP